MAKADDDPRHVARKEAEAQQRAVDEAVAEYEKSTIPKDGNASVTYRYEPFVKAGK